MREVRSLQSSVPFEPIPPGITLQIGAYGAVSYIRNASYLKFKSIPPKKDPPNRDEFIIRLQSLPKVSCLVTIPPRIVDYDGSFRFKNFEEDEEGGASPFQRS